MGIETLATGLPATLLAAGAPAADDVRITFEMEKPHRTENSRIRMAEDLTASGGAACGGSTATV